MLDDTFGIMLLALPVPGKVLERSKHWKEGSEQV